MSSACCCIVLIPLLLSFKPSETATTQFIEKPPTPSFAHEGQNVTFRWNYTLDGGLGLAQLFNGTGAGADVIGKTFEAGDIPINQEYQARFKGFATNTYAEMTILEVQRSDQGTFQLDVTPKGSGSLSDNLELVVQTVNPPTGTPTATRSSLNPPTGTPTATGSSRTPTPTGSPQTSTGVTVESTSPRTSKATGKKD